MSSFTDYTRAVFAQSFQTIDRFMTVGPDNFHRLIRFIYRHTFRSRLFSHRSCNRFFGSLLMIYIYIINITRYLYIQVALNFLGWRLLERFGLFYDLAQFRKTRDLPVDLLLDLR